MRLLIIVALVSALAPAGQAAPEPPRALVLWAWERPEDLTRAAPGVEVAAVTGFIQIEGDQIQARGRRFPLLTDAVRRTAVVHVQIDPKTPLKWTPALRARLAATVLSYGRAPGFSAMQIDFEVPASQRQALLDLVSDVRAALPASEPLSMNALASWCETEDWLAAAKADEIVPMVFRLGEGGAKLKAKLEAGGDFANPRCRSAIGLSTDTPLKRWPGGRRIYVFNPRSWTTGEIARVTEDIHP
jgi:hypothetical protein